MTIDEPTPQILAARAQWKLNRDMIAGEAAIKKAGVEYLPMLGTQTCKAEYDAYLKRVPFYPGASRTHDGLKGLIFRKEPALEVPKGLEAVFDTITYAGHTVEDLAEEIVSETLVTGFTGLLVDYPPATTDMMTMANVIEAGHRPYIAIYPAESFLEVTPTVIRNRLMLTRVRVHDDDDTIRELVLDSGIYTVIMHRRVNDVWLADAPVIATKNGKPLTEIPFVIVSTKPRSMQPVKGPLDDVCLINGHLYREQADAKNSRFFSSAPIFTVIGGKKLEPGDVVFGPSSIIQFPEVTNEAPVTVKFTEFSGAGQTALENAVQTLKNEMASVGSRILAPEKVAAEAAETLAIRQTSENATLAALARTLSRKIEESLNWVSWWLDREPVTFALSTDFLPTPMTPQERKQVMEEIQAGIYTHEMGLKLFVAGEVFEGVDIDIDNELALLAEQSLNVDRPAPEAAPRPEDEPTT